MSDQPSYEPDADAGTSAETGVPAVDEVLRSLDALAERPVDEHVEIFERAHEQLRRSLDADPAGQVASQAPGQGD